MAKTKKTVSRRKPAPSLAVSIAQAGACQNSDSDRFFCIVMVLFNYLGPKILVRTGCP